jgi:hypothetical protein
MINLNFITSHAVSADLDYTVVYSALGRLINLNFFTRHIWTTNLQLISSTIQPHLPSVTVLILLLIASALFRNNTISLSSNGTSIVFCTPPCPSTAGRLIYVPRLSTQWLTGLTCRWLSRIDSQMEETTEAMPYAVAPLAAMME